MNALVIMGSGETSPTMVTIHQRLLAAVDAPAVLLETPYGFQENASDISAKAVDYFRASVGRDVAPVGLRAPADEPASATDRALAAIRTAGWLFAGPGSPSYALRQWAPTEVPSAISDLLRRRGVAVFASAAACTLGALSVPVYEIYKVGAEPVWNVGLDLLREHVGIAAAVVPHFDNTEGGNHDTRFCYLGERRLSALERQLPEGVHVLGVDEHTALVLDLGEGTARVIGRGKVTARVHGGTIVWPAGSVLSLDELRAAMAGLAVSSVATPVAAPAEALAAEGGAEETAASLGEAADRAETLFAAAEEARDADGMVEAALGLEEAIRSWSTDTTQSPDGARAASVLRSLVVRLGAAAKDGLRDPAAALAPLVEPLLALRASLRAAKEFGVGDQVRDALIAGGVTIKDTPDGTTWSVS